MRNKSKSLLYYFFHLRVKFLKKNEEEVKDLANNSLIFNNVT